MLLLITALLATPPTAATSADTGNTISGVTLPAAIDVDGHTLELNGMALRKKIVFKVYVAGLYLTTKSSKVDDILNADEPRRLVMHFVRNVDKGKICDAWNEGLEDNTPDASADLKERFTELCGLMADIKDGQSFVFTYLPGQGTRVEVAGEDEGTIAGKDFADAMLRCWIGPKPGPGDDFKEKVLGLS